MGKLDDRDVARRVRSTVTDQLAAIGVRGRVGVVQLCAHLGRRRGRPIELSEAVMPMPGPFAYVRRHSNRDVVVFPQHPDSQYQLHNIAHELSHVLLDHLLGDELDLHHRPAAPDGTADITLPRPMPNVLSMSLAEFVEQWGNLKNRSGYEQGIEQEAEIGAGVLRPFLRADWTTSPLTRPAPAIELLEGALGSGEDLL